MSAADTRFVPRLDRRRLLTFAAAGAVIAPFASRSFLRSALAQEGALPPFFDPAIIHTVTVEFDQAAYDAMIQTFQESGEKEWIEATVTIDGATYAQAGLRLKGNSSLGGLRMGELPEPATPESTGNRRIVISGGGANAEEPERLPWLVRLDEYVPDQAHEGIEEFVIRANMSSTSLNEAVSLDLLTAAGLASQQAAYTSFSVNGSAPVLRLAIENPKEDWMAAHFSADGRLFKSEAEGDWSYKGEDAAAYTVAFDLEAGDTGDDAADYAPLIEFLAFLDTSDDATFASELPRWLDIDAFATYLAMMDLIENHDDIDGPGNNSYLYLDTESGQFTIVPWDMNLAFSGMGLGPGAVDEADVPEGARIFELPEGGTPEAVFEFGTPVPGGDGETGFSRITGGKPNPLVARFTANAEWTTLVTERTAALQASLYDSGAAAEILARWADLLETQAAELVDSATIAEESDAIAAHFTAA